jgi:Zn-dependent peptidase ImmA (M78 family)/transcriptional regulator with XRE-family HTH domain
MNSVIPERISQVRELAGLSKTELAEKLGVSVAAVTQWESGAKHPTSGNVVAMAQALGVQVNLLYQPVPDEMSRRGPITFRAKASAKTMRIRRQSQRFAEMVSEAFLWLEQWISLPVTNLPEIPAGTDPETAANMCRRAFGLGDRPILKLGELMESRGIRLCSASFGDVRLDAYSCMVGGRAFGFLGIDKQDRARSRFDAAHELGHLLSHQHYTEDELNELGKVAEDQADAFASAFLMPADTFSKDVVDGSLEGFKRLKPRWGVSVQAMVRRSKDLGLITEETYARHCRTISVYGWRRPKGEPLDETVPPMTRSLGRKSLDLLNATGTVQPWEISQALPLPDDVLRSVFGVDLSTLAPPELDNVILHADFAGFGRVQPKDTTK